MIRRIILSLILILVLPTIIIAQNNTTRFFVAYDYENLTVDTTVGGVSFDSTIVGSTAQSVTFTVACASGSSCPIRFTLDGTAPTTSVGLRADFEQSVTIYSNTNIKAFRAIREGATSAVLNVTYFR